MKANSPLKDLKVLKETMEILGKEYDPKTAQELKDKSAKTGVFNILSWKELASYQSPTYQWRIQNLIQDKKIIIVGGSSAVFKSWFCVAMGISVAKGMPFLDNFPVEKGGVLFIDRENSIPELQNRIGMLANGLGVSLEEDIPMFFLSEQSFRLDDSTNREFLTRFILDNKISLVVIDTYRRVIGFEENDANAVSIFFTQGLKPICESTGASFVFIHHHKKGKSEHDEKEMLRGSSDLVNFVDGVIQISRKGSSLTVKQTKNRSGKEIEPFELKVDTDEEEYFKFVYTGQKQDTTVQGKAVQLLSVWFAKSNIKEFKTSEAQKICFDSNIKKMNFFSALGELEKRGLISKMGHGKYNVCENTQDLAIVQSPLYKSSGQLDKLIASKSNSPNSSIGLTGQLDKSDRDTQYFEAQECENIKPADKQEVLDFITENPNYTLKELLDRFGSGVMIFKKEGLIK